MTPHLPGESHTPFSPLGLFLSCPSHLILCISYLCACLISLTRPKDQKGCISKESLDKLRIHTKYLTLCRHSVNYWTTEENTSWYHMANRAATKRTKLSQGISHFSQEIPWSKTSLCMTCKLTALRSLFLLSKAPASHSVKHPSEVKGNLQAVMGKGKLRQVNVFHWGTSISKQHEV